MNYRDQQFHPLWLMLFLLPAFLLLAGCRGRSAAIPEPLPLPHGEPAPDSVVAWFRKEGVPFHSVDPSSKDGDLAPLTARLRNAQLVGLGEATHGTHEFFLMKHRLVRELVLGAGYRIFLMEADAATSCAIDDYIQGGSEDPRQLLRDLKVWTWNNDEFLDLLNWLRSYNRVAGAIEALHFYGMDMQDPFLSQKVIEIFRQVDPEVAEHARDAYACMKPTDDREAMERNYRQIEVDDQLRCTAAVAAVAEELERRVRSRQGEAPATPRESCALWTARMMIQAERLLRFPSIRDRLYAETVLDVVEKSRKKIMIWAHNGHVANGRGAMGRWVKRQLGDRYLIVGMTAYSGEFRARKRLQGGGATAAVPVLAALPPEDSYEAALHRVGEPRLLVDLTGLRGADVTAPGWLRGPHPMRDVGGAYDERLANGLVSLPEAFDFLFYFDSGSASSLFPPKATTNN